MLKEMINARQNPNERRRVFFDDFFDLYVWLDQEGSISGFQLCYGGSNAQKALTWQEGKGYHHASIDLGESRLGKYKSSPILCPDGPLPKEDILDRFSQTSNIIDTTIRDFVLMKLAEYPSCSISKPQ